MTCLRLNDADPFFLDYFVGDTAPLRMAIAKDEKGSAYDLTGCALTLSVKAAEADPDESAVWRRETGTGIAIIAPAGGVFLVTPTLAESRALSAGTTYHVDLVMRDANGAWATLGTGRLLARKRITSNPV